MQQSVFTHSILKYLVDEGPKGADEPTKLPPLGDLAKELGVSRGKLREDLITAQAYGLVEMRPGDGTYICPFDFYAAIRPAVLYSIACDKLNFDHFYQVRARLEVVFWEQAVCALDQADFQVLDRILERAERKLGGVPIEIPHDEHRELHLRIFSRLDNTFVQGLLNTYWDAYEAVELHRYFELSYYERMWSSHRELVALLKEKRYQEGKETLIKHFRILEARLQGTAVI
ncbi:MAG: FadR family transcriptional regulator [Anaerolineae bacterium]|nr:FadR family transcriptional regulator [Anaerolineae bacterium]